MWQRNCLLTIGIFINVFYVYGATIQVNPGDNLQSVINNAGGGDVVVINGGTYGVISIKNRIFSTNAPLIIKAGSQVPTIKNSSISGGPPVDFENTAYVVLDGLKMEGGIWGLWYANLRHYF